MEKTRVRKPRSELAQLRPRAAAAEDASLLRSESGESTAVLEINRDITARKQAEERLQRVEARTAELTAVNKELEAFTYAVAHDLRAPLRHIHGFSDILRRDPNSNLSAEGRHCLECIVQGIVRMEKLLEDLLNLSRLGRQAVHVRPVRLNELVADVIQELSPDIHDRLIEWQMAALPVVLGDRSLLKIVLTNLLSNAVKFTRLCTTAVIEVGVQDCAGETAIFVRDNGAGFDMKYAGKLFGVFQRLHGEKDYEGTGIGLATVRRILQKHGGRIWAEGEVGKGATFYFTLGRNSLEEEQPQSAGQEKA